MTKIYMKQGLRAIVFCCALATFSQAKAQSGNNLLFDGVDDYVVMPNNILSGVTGDVTIETWVYWKGGDNNFQRIFDFGTDQNNWVAVTPSIPFETFTGSGIYPPRFAINIGGAFEVVDATVNLPQNAWSHIAITQVGATGQTAIYINGVQSNSLVLTGRISSLASSTLNRLGESKYPGNPYYNGNIDELRISNTVRYTGTFTPASQFTPDANTLALFHFDEGTGQSTADATSNFAAATLGSNPTAADGNDPTWALTVLPVKLTAFNATAQDKHVDLSWSASLDHGGYFDVQRSTDGRNFTSISTVSVADATQGVQSFSFRDNDPGNGRIYYRLKCVENGLAGIYSRTIPVVLNGEATVAVYPNPLKGSQLNIELAKPYTGDLTLTLTNAAGAVVLRQQLRSESRREFQVDVNVPKGSYLLQVKTSTGTQSQMIVRQ